MRFIISKVIFASLLLTCLNHTYAQNSSGERKTRPPRPEFSSIDSNQNDEIDFTEFSQHKLPFGDHQTVFDTIDSNQDGVIDEEEYVNHKPPHRHGNSKKEITHDQ